MSISTRIFTHKEINIIEIATRIATINLISLGIKENNSCATLYRPHISTTEVQIRVEEYGYLVNLNILACKKDFELYRIVVGHIIAISDGMALFEDDSQVVEVEKFFNNSFIEERLKHDFDKIMLMMKDSQSGSISCPIRKFHYGKWVYKNILRQGKFTLRQREYFHDMIRNSQYYLISDRDSPVTEEAGKINIQGHHLTKTIYIKNQFDYISHADRFVLVTDDGEFIDLPYDELHRIAPISWTRIDEHQYFARQLDDDKWETFIRKALLVMNY